jgi:outer membrane protein assembly factor BamB
MVRAARCLATAFVVTLLAAAAHAATPMWTFKGGDLQFQRVSPLGTLLVSHAGGLTALDPATGKALWERADLKSFKECNYDEIENTPYALLDGKQFEVIDLQTGQKKWDSSKLPFKSSSGQMQIAHKRLLLVFGMARAGAKPTVVALDTETGEMKWQQDKLFDKPLRLFEVKGSGRVFKRQSIAGNQPPAFPDDHSVVVWVTEDGPTCIDLETGARKWVCAGLKGKTPAALNDGFCGMWARDGVIYVPYEKSLQAIDASSGALLWTKEKDFRGRPVQMAWSPAGLVVRGASFMKDDGKPAGKPFIDCLDPKTGVSVWPKPFKDLEDATSFDMKGDHLYICADNELHQVGLAQGADRILAKFKFKEHEVPNGLELLDDGGFLLTSSQTILKLDGNGAEQARAYYEAPSLSGWVKLGVGVLTAAVNAAAAGSAYDRAQRYGTDQTYYLASNPTLGKRFRATQATQQYQYILTSVEEGGKKRAGIVRVDRYTGKVASSVQLNEKKPEYEVDEVEGLLYFQASDDTVEAYRM